MSLLDVKDIYKLFPEKKKKKLQLYFLLDNLIQILFGVFSTSWSGKINGILFSGFCFCCLLK